jgi:repressor of nif and glnA expression
MTAPRYQPLIDLLNECSVACNHCSVACLDESNTSLLVDCIKTDMDCAIICSSAAILLARESDHGVHLLKECIEICNVCAGECEKHLHHDHCKKCAEVCRRCAEACTAVL